MRKLNKIIKYKDIQEKFINDYIIYLAEYNWYAQNVKIDIYEIIIYTKIRIDILGVENV